MIEKSCGTIPYTVIDGTAHFLLIKDKNGSSGFPKGHVENDETEIETALRETLEETSVKVQIISEFRYEMSYKMANGNTKKVVYFLARFENQAPKRNKDFEDYSYLALPFEKAYSELTFENAKEMLKAANDFLSAHR